MSIARHIEAGQGSWTVHIGATAFIGLQIDQNEYSSGELIEGTAVGSSARPGSPRWRRPGHGDPRSVGGLRHADL